MPAETYDAEYFHKPWRDAAEGYTLEDRRRIEGRHPELIRDTFRPTTVLDFGCGPGALMALLQEVGIWADGVDFAPASIPLAPSAVRDRIGLLRSRTLLSRPAATSW